MPIDPSIALGVRPVQLQTIDPMTIYSAMENQRMNALREQALQQDMQRNALIMQNTMEDRRAAAAQAALARRQQEEFKRMVQAGYQPPKTAVMGPGTIQGDTPASYDYEGVKNRLIGSGNLTGYEALSKAQEQEANRLKAQLAARNEGFTGNKIQAETQGLNLKNADTQLAQVASSIDRAPTMEAVYAIYSAVPDALAVRGQTPETAIQAFNAHVAELSKTMPPNEAFAQARRDVANGAMATQKQLSEIATAQKPEIKNVSGVGMVTINPYTAEGKRVTVDGQPLSATTSEIPELKKGERWNAEKQRVEATEGSDIYIAQSQKHGKDFNAVNTVKSATDAALANIDKILAPENESAFNSNFGGYNAYATRMQSGPTQTIGAAIDSLRSTMKATGAQLMRSQGGAVGSITEREWPILEGMVASLNPLMPEKDAREIIANVRQRLANLNDISKETYDATWGNTQYYNPKIGGGKTGGATSGASATTPSGVPVLNWD